MKNLKPPPQKKRKKKKLRNVSKKKTDQQTTAPPKKTNRAITKKKKEKGEKKNNDAHIDDEGVVDAEEDALLVLDVLHLFQSDDVGDGQDLQRPVLARALLAAQHHPAERTRSYFQSKRQQQ